MHSLRKPSLAIAAAISMLGFLFAAAPVHADVDPVGCHATGGTIILTTYRADGVTPIADGTVIDGELIKYQATLMAAPSPVCAFQGGTWTLTTPDAVVHDLGVVPRIGGSGVPSLDSALISYTVNHPDELVNGTRHVNASTSYGGGISHRNAGDSLPGPGLSTTEQTPVIHTPTVTTNVHDASHAVITDAPIGSSVHDNASVVFAGGPTLTGTVDFKVFNNTGCTGDPASTQAGVALVAGVAESNPTSVPNTGMSYLVHYNGDTNFSAADAQCEPLTADKLTPQVSTDIHSAAHGVITTATAGDTAHDKATVSGTITPTGNVDFTFFPNASCTKDTGASAGVVALDVSGIAHPSNSEGPLAQGSYSFLAHYEGDANYLAGDAQCEPLTVTNFTPTIATQLSASSIVVGGSAHDSSTLINASSDAGGTVTYTVYTDNACTLGAQSAGTKGVTNGVVTDSDPITFNSAGTFYWQAVYSGDANNAGATSPCQSEILTVADKGHIVVDKVTNPAADPTSFTFTTSGAGYSGFSLTDAAAPNDQALDAGTYSVAETPVSGWTQTSVVCTSSLGGTENPASIGLSAGETVTCVFTNTKAVTACSPGYWKNHTAHWPAPYLTSDKFDTVFGRPAFPANKTLLQVLQQGGGGINALGRQTVSALLNAAALGNYPLTPAQVISAFQAAWDSHNFGPLQSQLEGYGDNCTLN